MNLGAFGVGGRLAVRPGPGSAEWRRVALGRGGVPAGGPYGAGAGPGENWWLCTALANNETGIDWAFRESVAPPRVLAKLMEQHAMLGAG